MMKKNFPKILAGCTAMVLMTGALLVPSMAVNASAHRGSPSPTGVLYRRGQSEGDCPESRWGGCFQGVLDLRQAGL